MKFELDELGKGSTVRDKKSMRISPKIEFIAVGKLSLMMSLSPVILAQILAPNNISTIFEVPKVGFARTKLLNLL